MIKISGSSDDTVSVDGCKGADEFLTYEKGPLMWRGDLVGPDGGQLRVYGICDGCWHFSIGQTDEGIPLPRWSIFIDYLVKLSGGAGYSAQLSIDAPDGTRLTNVWPTRTP